MPNEDGRGGRLDRAREIKNPQSPRLLIRDKQPAPSIGMPHDGTPLVIARKALGTKARKLVIRIFGARVRQILAQTKCLITRKNMPALGINGQCFDFFAPAPCPERSCLDPTQDTRAVIHDPVLVQVPLTRSKAIGAADDGKHCAIDRSRIGRDTHHIARTFTLKDRHTAAIRSTHIGQGVDTQTMRESLCHDHHVATLTPDQHVIGHIDIVRPREAPDDFVVTHTPIKPKDIQRTIRVLVGAENQTFSGIGAVDPNGGIIGIVLDRFGDDARLHGRGSSAPLRRFRIRYQSKRPPHEGRDKYAAK